MSAMAVQWKDKKHWSANQLIWSRWSIILVGYPLVGRLLPLIGVICWPVEPAVCASIAGWVSVLVNIEPPLSCQGVGRSNVISVCGKSRVTYLV